MARRDNGELRELDAQVAEEVMEVELCHHELHETKPVCKYCHLNEGFWQPKWGRIEPPNHYSTDMAHAWPVHKMACSWLFSKRRLYLVALQGVVCERLRKEGELRVKGKVAWPDVLVFLGPIDICNAALEVVRDVP